MHTLLNSRRTQILLYSFCFGCFVWFLEGVVDHWFYEGDFLDLLILDVPRHEIYIRSLVLLAFVGYGFIYANVFERNQAAQRAIKENEEFLRGQINGIRDIVFLVSAKGALLALNEAAIRSLDGTRMQLLGQNISSLLDPSIEHHLDEVAKAKAPITHYQDISGMTDEVRLFPVFDSHNKVARVAIVIRNITEEIRYQEQLKKLTSQLSLVEERERRRISEDLHDNVGQKLALCKMKLSSLLANPKKKKESANSLKPIGDVCRLLESAISETRSLTSDLSPQVLYQLGLEAALEDLSHMLTSHTSLRVRFNNDGVDGALGDDIRISLYRACREVMYNVVRHARANVLDVQIAHGDDTIEITFTDDGVGFKNPGQWQGSGMGLFNVKERIGNLGGSFQMESQAGCGTTVTITAPMSMDDSAVGG
jgi:two-component system, NarL family, sensor histidine kinase UhpB